MQDTAKMAKKITSVLTELVAEITAGGSWENVYNWYAKKYGVQFANNLFTVLAWLVTDGRVIQKMSEIASKHNK